MTLRTKTVPVGPPNPNLMSIDQSGLKINIDRFCDREKRESMQRPRKPPQAGHPLLQPLWTSTTCESCAKVWIDCPDSQYHPLLQPVWTTTTCESCAKVRTDCPDSQYRKNRSSHFCPKALHTWPSNQRNRPRGVRMVQGLLLRMMMPRPVPGPVRPTIPPQCVPIRLHALGDSLASAWSSTWAAAVSDSR
jgi:hypothetical protein